MAMVRRHNGHHPVDVDVMSDQDAVIELEPGVRVGEIAQLLHGTHEWDGQPVEISCLLSTQLSIINVVQECKIGCTHLQQLKDEQCRVREEQQQYQEQLAKLLLQYQGEVREVEKLQQNQADDNQMILGAGGMEEPKSFKPQTLPPFSGADPVPKDKASCEQWIWQAKEALKSCIAGAVRIALVQSVRGEVRKFSAAVGFEASVEVLLEKIEDKFGEKWIADGLQQEFYKIAQGKNEKVRKFAGKLEAQFKHLKEKVPGRYDNNILKELFFHGMHQHLKDSTRFCYEQEETTYEELF